MKQRKIGKALAVAVIILFMGVGIQPAIATIEPKTSDNYEDCNLCTKKVSKQHLVLIESLLNTLDTFVNKLSVKTKHNPIIEMKYQEFSKRFSFVKEIYMDYMLYWDFPVLLLLHLCICSILLILEVSLFAIVFYAWYFEIDYDFPIMNAMIDILATLSILLYCPGSDPPHSFLLFN